MKVENIKNNAGHSANKTIKRIPWKLKIHKCKRRKTPIIVGHSDLIRARRAQGSSGREDRSFMKEQKLIVQI